mgnify:CR=1 FL=1
MTTQLSLLNMTGLSVASDTLATIRNGSAFKVSHGNSKIFEPTGNHMFVVYHSGSSAMNNVPSRLIVDSWFKSLTKPLPTIDAYVANFKKFLESPKAPHTKSSEREVAIALAADMVELTRENINKTGVKPDDSKAWNEALIAEAKEALAYYQAAPQLEGWSEATSKEVLQRIKVNLRGHLKIIYPEGYPARFATILQKAFCLRLGAGERNNWDSFLTFAGFGTNDLYPQSRRLFIRGVIDGKLQSEVEHEVKIEAEGQHLGIVYGAQSDAIYGLVQGYRKVVESHVHNTITSLIPEFPEVQELATDVVKGMQTITGKDFVNPAFRRIANLSISELAETAKDMVNLQILSAKLSGSSETVGGEIEVVTIDKINGIRWQNRI